MQARLSQPQLAALACVLDGVQPRGTRRSDLVRLAVCDLVRLEADGTTTATARARRHKVVWERDRAVLVAA